MCIISLTCSKESAMSGSLREGLRPRVDLACIERRAYLNIVIIYRNMAYLRGEFNICATSALLQEDQELYLPESNHWLPLPFTDSLIDFHWFPHRLSHWQALTLTFWIACYQVMQKVYMYLQGYLIFCISLLSKRFSNIFNDSRY